MRYEQTKPVCVDLFCGCGGISAGAKLAGYDVRAGVDSEPKYASSFKLNFPQAKLLEADISGFSPEEFLERSELQAEDIYLLCGGPPCQGFSKNVPRSRRFLSDPRNALVGKFLEFAEFLRPSIVLMENVAEMKNGFDGHYAEEISERLKAAGYRVCHAVLNSADLGIPQRRRRAFFIANRLGVDYKFPQKTHWAVLGESNSSKQKHVSVWDAISDLSSLSHGDGNPVDIYRGDATSDYQTMVRNQDGMVKNHISRKLQKKQFERISSLAPGQGLKDLPAHLQTKGGYSGAYGRLTWEMVAPTITRWVFHPGSGRWGHPVDDRLISIREAARLQGFPDWYEFSGTYIEQAGQLGNAVPPLLVKVLLEAFDEQLRGQSSLSNSANLSKEIRLCGAGS